MCIYLGNQSNVTYSSREHIIPAGLGGMNKLPVDYVSDNFNNYFSKFERLFLRNTVISVPRQILGPGKRGSLNDNKATKSSINVFKHTVKDQYSLGYIKKGKPFEIPHIVFNATTKQYFAGMNKNIGAVDFETFLKQLKQYTKLTIRKISFPELKDEFIIGIQSGIEDHFDGFIAGADPESHPFTQELLGKFSNLLENKDAFDSYENFHIRTHQTARVDENYFFCCAKTAFNVLAHLTSKEFVMKNEFDAFKDWLLKKNQKNTDFAFKVPSPLQDFKNIFPENSHYVLIYTSEQRLIADVFFYNHFNCKVILSHNFTLPFEFDGFICDWQNKLEYRFLEYLSNKNYNSN